jgi:hypothetical protein
MLPGVYIGTQPTGDYGLISTGDYINPAAFSFTLSDSHETIIKQNQLYLVINDVKLEYIKVSIVGSNAYMVYDFSLDGNTWIKEINIRENIDAMDTTILRPFYFRFQVQDIIEYFIYNNATRITNFKIRLLFG